MKLIRYIIAYAVMTLSIGMYSQSASATDVVLQECMSCHSGVVADKVAVGDEGAYWLHSTQTKRQITAAVVSANPRMVGDWPKIFSGKKWVVASRYRKTQMVTADYLAGFKDEPGWQA